MTCIYMLRTISLCASNSACYIYLRSITYIDVYNIHKHFNDYCIY